VHIYTSVPLDFAIALYETTPEVFGKERTSLKKKTLQKKIMADQYQVPLFFTIPGFRMRLVMIGE
jgi:hypothetical protein